MDIYQKIRLEKRLDRKIELEGRPSWTALLIWQFVLLAGSLIALTVLENFGLMQTWVSPFIIAATVAVMTFVLVRFVRGRC